MLGPFGEIHGVRETALLAQPVPAAGREVGHRVGGEELGVTRRRVASSATAFAPFSQNSAACRWSGSGHAQPGQSKPFF